METLYDVIAIVGAVVFILTAGPIVLPLYLEYTVWIDKKLTKFIEKFKKRRS